MVKDKAQVTLEACLIFVAVVLFFFGIIQVWLWLDTTIADRATQYNETRRDAAYTADRTEPLLLKDYFNSRPLDEEWVFSGQNQAPLQHKAIPEGNGTSSRIANFAGGAK